MVSRSFFFLFTNASYFIPQFESQPPPEATNKNTAPPLMGKLPRRIAQAIRPQTERLNTISAQRWLFSIPLFSHIHFKKSVVPKVYHFRPLSLSYCLCSHSFCFSRPVNNVVFAKFHALKTRGVKKNLSKQYYIPNKRANFGMN